MSQGACYDLDDEVDMATGECFQLTLLALGT